jgi:glycosyltransferase involved in cell wall biosynthesis
VKPVLHVITTISRGGAEIQLLTLVREQRLSNREVNVLYLKDSPELDRELSALGVKVLHNIAKMSFVKQVFWTRQFLKDFDVIIHSHLPRAQILVALAKRTQPTVISRHDAERFFANGNKLLSICLARFVALRSDSAVAISGAVANTMKQSCEFPKNFPIEVVHYGYNPGFLKNTLVSPIMIDGTELKLSKKLVFGTIARLVEQKDHPTLLKAFAMYCNNFSDTYLIIVGDGSLKDELIQLAAELGINEKVCWLGHRTDIPEVLNNMDVFILASKTEGFGLVLLEAMSRGLPIIGSKSTAIPEVLGDDGGMLFETGNAQQLFEHMEQLRNPQVRKEMADKALNRLDFFAPQNLLVKLDKIYEKAGG